MKNDREHFRRRSQWREVVEAKAVTIRHELDRLAACAHENLRETEARDELVNVTKSRTDEHLAQALSAAAPRRRGAGPFWRVLAGGESAVINAAFVNLHHAKAGLVELYGEDDIEAAAPAVLARLRSYVAPNDARLAVAESMFGPILEPHRVAPVRPGLGPWWRAESGASPTVTSIQMPRESEPRKALGSVPVQRAVLREGMQASYEAADELHAQARAFRDALIITTVILSMLALAVCALGALRPAAIPLCFSGEPPDVPACPSATDTTTPSPLDVPVVALMGLLGGALSVTFTVQRLRGTSAPYYISIALLLSKLPSGAVTGVVGLLLVHGEFIPGLSTLDSQGQILAWAILLGFAQHLVTRFVDQRAEEVINSLPRKTGQPNRPANQEDAGDSAIATI